MPIRIVALSALCVSAVSPLFFSSSSAAPYGDTPEDVRPYQGAGEPYRRLFMDPVGYPGPGRDDPDPQGLATVRLGVLAPLKGPDRPLGASVLAGISLALAEANAEGGLNGVPFETVVLDEQVPWGDAVNRLTQLAYQDKVWAVLGCLEDTNSHVITRLTLKVHIPVVNTCGTDPTLTEHAIPWLIRVRPDDRQNAYRLARKIFEQDGRKRVAVLRANDRYARTGIAEITDAARRLGYPFLLEVRFPPEPGDLTPQVERIRAAKPDAVVLWGRAEAAAEALRQLRAAGVSAPVYGPDRLVDPRFLARAGTLAEGLIAVHPFLPGTLGEAWTDFVDRYRQHEGRDPDFWAAYAYDGTRYLVQCLRSAGLNRVRIRDALWETPAYTGVTGPFRFDPTRNNLGRVGLARVVDGEWVFEE